MTETETINKLREDALAIASEHDELTRTTTQRQAAEARVLAGVVEAVRPALRAMASRIATSERTSGLATDRQRECKTHHDTPGLRVDGDGLEEDCPRDFTGSHEGSALYLLADGTFAVLTYSGSWSRWQGSTSWWEAEVVPVTVDEVPANGWSTDEIVARIAKALASHQGTRKAASARNVARAEKLGAVAAPLSKKGS